jgi:hypothetical protein
MKIYATDPNGHDITLKPGFLKKPGFCLIAFLEVLSYIKT